MDNWQWCTSSDILKKIKWASKYYSSYELEEDFSRETALEFGRLYRKDNDWRFQAVGQGYNSGLQGFVDKYAS